MLCLLPKAVVRVFYLLFSFKNTAKSLLQVVQPNIIRFLKCTVFVLYS